MSSDQNRAVKLFSDRSHYRREDRGQLSDLLRPNWKDGPFGDKERKEMYGVSLEDFCLVESLGEADLAVLPMTWNHYLARGETSRAADFIQLARRAGRPILSYVSGDEGVTVPAGFEDVFVVRASGCRARRRQRQFAQPVFFDDPLKRPLAPSTVHRPPSSAALATVGFCGQASVNAVKGASDIMRAAWRNLLYRLRLRQEEPQPLFSSALLRARAMKTLAESPLVKARFIARARYRGAAATPEARERTTREFYENIAETDYTLCVRGGGNFSKRFYETLAMGRIPILLDTDCLLPFEPELDWDKYIVRVPREQLRSLPQAVARHFATLGERGLAALQRACRRLWEEELTFGGFHRRLARIILQPGGASEVTCSAALQPVSLRP